jgi:6-phosphogluconolactonase
VARAPVIGKLEIVADDSALARAAAEHFVAAARLAKAERGKFVVALAGGTTPKAMFALLTAEPLRSSIEWDSVRFYFGDERCVPPDDPESNYGMARKHLFEPLEISEEHVYRMRGEADPDDAAGEYEDLLKKMLGDPPVFDLILLGMGPDGHTASLFPGTLDQVDPDWLVAPIRVRKLNARRITLTPRTINGARAILVVAGGEGKAAALAQVLAGPRDPNLYPAQILNPDRGTLTWLVDRAAAKGLSE